MTFITLNEIKFQAFLGFKTWTTPLCFVFSEKWLVSSCCVLVSIIGFDSSQPASLVLLVNIIMLVNGICAVFSAGFEWDSSQNTLETLPRIQFALHHHVLWGFKCACASSSPWEIYKTTAFRSLFFNLPTDWSHPLCGAPALFKSTGVIWISQEPQNQCCPSVPILSALCSTPTKIEQHVVYMQNVSCSLQSI